LEETRERKHPDLTGLIIGLSMVPVYILFASLGRQDLALSACVVSIPISLAVRIHWDLRKRIWFWAVMAIILALHASVIIHFQWPRRWLPGMALLPVALADFLITMGVIRVAQMLTEKFLSPDDV
jgi:hypothetical protein